MKESKKVSTLSVKEYAALIDRSDKTVYKMIKEGLVGARKGNSGYEVVVDSYVIGRCKDINKSLGKMNDMIASFQKRLEALEEKSIKKPTAKKKSLTPLKKAIKKPLKKRTLKSAPKKSIKKGLKHAK